MSIKLNQCQTLGLWNLMHTNLTDSIYEITHQNEDGSILVEVTSPSVPGARRTYSVSAAGGNTLLGEERIKPDLLKQDTEEEG